jgi:hypothetical protein
LIAVRISHFGDEEVSKHIGAVISRPMLPDPHLIDEYSTLDDNNINANNWNWLIEVVFFVRLMYKMDNCLTSQSEQIKNQKIQQ